MTKASEQLVYEHLGERALAYLLATDVVAIRTRFTPGEDTESLDHGREVVLAQLVGLDEQMRTWNQPEQFLTSEWSRKLAERHESADMSIGNYARQLSGGILQSIPTNLGPPEEALARLALESYPGLSVKEPEGPFGRWGMPISLFRHPLNDAFQDVVMQDHDLKMLFPDSNESVGPSGSTMRSSGQGGTHQIWTFAETIIMSGWKSAHAKLENPSAEDHLIAVLENLAIVRSAVRSELVTIPARLGLVGVLLPEGVDNVDLGWALIRRADQRDGQFANVTSLDGQLTTTTPAGETVVINYSGDLVVEFEVPYVVQLESFNMADEWPDALRGGQDLIAEIAQNIRLGLLLASPEKRLILVPTWQVSLDPFTQGTGASWFDAKQTPGLMPTQLTVEQVAEWQEWSVRVAKHRIPSIDVAIRRMLAAVAERRTPDDVLVDAVIVWENLFGARTETTLRVTSSLAWLLGASAADRRARQTRYKKIYGTRSDVVHGATTVDQKRLLEVSAEAVQVSVEALRAIFGRRSALLESKTSEDRSLQILHEG